MKRFLNSIIIYVTTFLLLFQTFDNLQADEIVLPKPGTLVGLSMPINPPILKGIKVFPDNPFRLDFVLSQGDSTSAEASAQEDDLKNESTKLIKYFLAALTVPERDLWVNLSPYEKDRIVPDSFGQTQMGRDLLAQDYMLKQITASLIYPENKTGKQFWQRIYEDAALKYGSVNIPVNTFNKVWIVPNKATIYENIETGTAYVVESSLKVMLEADYLAVKKTAANQATQGLTVKAPQGKQHSQVQIVKEIVIPQLTKEINTGENFVALRQIYNSFILATWYKNKIQQGILHEVYNNQNKVKGIRASKDLNVKQVYDNYLNSFKKGAYNFIKEEKDPITQKIYPRKYFSGGVNLTNKNILVKGVNVDLENNSDMSIVKIRLDYDNAMSVMPVVKDNLKDLIGYFSRVMKALKTRNIKEETKVVDDELSKRIYELAWKPITDKLNVYRKSLLNKKESAVFKNNTFWFSVMYRFAQLEVAEGGWFLLPTLNDLSNRLKNGVDYRVSEIKQLLDSSRRIYLLNESYDPSKNLVIIIRGAYAPPKFYGNLYLAVKEKYNVAYFEYNEFSRVEIESLNFLMHLKEFFLKYKVKGKYAIYTHSHGGVIADYAKRLAIKDNNSIFKDHELIAVAPVLGGSTKALVYNNFIIRNILLRFFDGNISLLEAHYPNGFIQQELFKGAILESISGVKKGMMISAPDDPHNVSNDQMQQGIFKLKMEGFKDIRIVFAGHQEIANHPEAVLYAMQHLDLVLNNQPETKVKTGGIDLDARQLAISMQNDSKGIDMTFDPVLIEQLKHVAGFRPTIVGIEPFKKGKAGSVDLRLFLGLH